MVHLERLTEAQSQSLEKLSALVDRLQRENTSLKTGHWSEMQRTTVKIELDGA